MIPNFRWQIPGKLAGMSRPLVGLGTDDEADLDFLRGQGVTAIVSLTRRPLAADVLERHGFEHLHLPVVDFEPPGMEQVAEFVAWVNERIAAQGRVAVHCQAGQGRTGTLLACYLVSLGALPGEAIRQIRAKLPAAIETGPQEQAIHQWWQILSEASGR